MTTAVLGLVAAPDDRAARALGTLGLTPEVVRDAASATVPPSVTEAPTLVPYEAAARAVLEATFREAAGTGDEQVDREHLLRALVAHEDGSGLRSGLGVEGLGGGGARPRSGRRRSLTPSAGAPR